MEMKSKNIKIAVLSGKGGTGKTLVSVNLAAVAGEAVYIDCDVEEPDGYLFFKPRNVLERIIKVKIPSFIESRCSSCRRCVDFCRFNALAFINNKPFLFTEICHSCGGCVLICPDKAVTEKEKTIGKILIGDSEGVTVNTGILNVGETSGMPIIKALLNENVPNKEIPVFIDCPPGSACIVMESIKDADYCVLVAEPTIFGVHNLSMVYELVKLLNKPCGAVINKYLEGEDPTGIFCLENRIRVLCRIPYDNELGVLSSNAKIATRESERFNKLFSSLLENLMKDVRYEAAFDPER